jgi:hypothetical protein
MRLIRLQLKCLLPSSNSTKYHPRTKSQNAALLLRILGSTVATFVRGPCVTPTLSVSVSHT